MSPEHETQEQEKQKPQEMKKYDMSWDWVFGGGLKSRGSTKGNMHLIGEMLLVLWLFLAVLGVLGVMTFWLFELVSFEAANTWTLRWLYLLPIAGFFLYVGREETKREPLATWVLGFLISVFVLYAFLGLYAWLSPANYYYFTVVWGFWDGLLAVLYMSFPIAWFIEYW